MDPQKRNNIVQFLKTSPIAEGGRLLSLFESDLIGFQHEVATLKSAAYIHPRMVIQMIDDGTLSDLKLLAEHHYVYHELTNLLNDYMGIPG